MVDTLDPLRSVVNALIEAKRSLRRDAFETGQDRMCSPEQFAQAFCTIRLDLGRRAGHTTIIREMFRQEAGDHVIMMSSAWRANLRSGMPPIPDTNLWNGRFDRRSKVGNPILFDRGSIIWVDGWGFASEHQRDEAYQSILDEAQYGNFSEPTAELPIIVLLG